MEEINFDLFLNAFPFGHLDEREGEYIAKVETALDALPPEDKLLLMELLDLQWTAVVEQLGLINKYKDSPHRPGRADAAMTRLQLNSNIRQSHGLPIRNIRSALMKISAGDLLGHIEAAGING